MYIILLWKRKMYQQSTIWYINESDEHKDTISDSSKLVDASNEPITDTHIVEGINNLSVRIVYVKPSVIGVEIIGQGITQGVINRSMNIGRNIVMDILTNYSKQLLETNTFQLNSLQSETLMIEPQDVRDNVAANLCAPINNALGVALSNDSDSDDGWLDRYDSNW